MNSDNRAVFRHSVSLEHRDTHAVEVFDNLRIQSRCAGDKHAHISAESVVNVFKQFSHRLDIKAVQLLSHRDALPELRRLSGLLRLFPDSLVHHLEYERHAYDNRRFTFLHIFDDIFQSLAQRYRTSLIMNGHVQDRKFICMMYGKNREGHVLFKYLYKHRHIHDIRHDIFMRQHDTFRQTCRP